MSGKTMGNLITWCLNESNPLCGVAQSHVTEAGEDYCAPLYAPKPIDHNHKDELTIPAKETALKYPLTDSLIWQMAREIGAQHPFQNISALKDINGMVRGLGSKKSDDEGIILARSGEEIFSDRPMRGGCHDWAIAFAALARAVGFPVVFVEGADIAFLKGVGDYAGHSFLKIFVKDFPDDAGRWILVDPGAGVYYNETTVQGGCLPGPPANDGAETVACERVEMYETQNLWDVGFGIDPVKQCLRVFQKNFQEDFPIDPDLSAVTFRPNRF